MQWYILLLVDFSTAIKYGVSSELFVALLLGTMNVEMKIHSAKTKSRAVKCYRCQALLTARNYMI